LRDIENIRGSKQSTKKKDTKWHKLLKDLEIKPRNLKNTRHTFAVSALESNAFTNQAIANILGHGSLAMLHNHYAKWIKGKALSADRNIDIFGDTFGDTSKNDIFSKN